MLNWFYFVDLFFVVCFHFQMWSVMFWLMFCVHYIFLLFYACFDWLNLLLECEYKCLYQVFAMNIHHISASCFYRSCTSARAHIPTSPWPWKCMMNHWSMYEVVVVVVVVPRVVWWGAVCCLCAGVMKYKGMRWHW